MKMRPVRLPPCAAGARPTTRSAPEGRRSRAAAAPSRSAPAKRAAVVARGLLAPLHQPRAARAGDDLVASIARPVSLARRSWQHAQEPELGACRSGSGSRAAAATRHDLAAGCPAPDVDRGVDVAGGVGLDRDRDAAGPVVDEVGQRHDAIVERIRRARSRKARARYDFWFHSSGAMVASSSSSRRASSAHARLGHVDAEVLLGQRGRPSSARCSGRRARRPSWPASRTSSCPTRPGRWCRRSRCRARSRFPSSWSWRQPLRPKTATPRACRSWSGQVKPVAAMTSSASMSSCRHVGARA